MNTTYQLVVPQCPFSSMYPGVGYRKWSDVIVSRLSSQKSYWTGTVNFDSHGLRRKLHNLTWTGHRERMDEMKNAYTISVGIYQTE